MGSEGLPLHEQYGILEKDLLFIHKYIEYNFNGKKAWQELHPKCTDNAATVQASVTLRKPNIQAAYRKELRFHFEYLGANSDMVLNEIKAIANSDIVDYIEQDKDGEISVKNVNDLQNSKVIKKISVIPTSINMGENVYKESKKITIELHDKIKALQMMGDSLGVFEGNNGKDDPKKLTIVKKVINSRDDIAK